MKRVTKNNLLKYIELKKEYMANKDAEVLVAINNFTEVINKDKKYYSKLTSYEFESKQLEYLL